MLNQAAVLHDHKFLGILLIVCFRYLMRDLAILYASNIRIRSLNTNTKIFNYSQSRDSLKRESDKGSIKTQEATFGRFLSVISHFYFQFINVLGNIPVRHQIYKECKSGSSPCCRDGLYSHNQHILSLYHRFFFVNDKYR